MFSINEETIRLIEALVPLVVFLFGVFFKMGMEKKEELAHALSAVLERLRAGEIDVTHAKEIVLATGVVSESKVQKVLDEVQLRLDGKKVEVYKDNVIPGVGISVDTGGEFTVHPEGILCKWGHKANKWLKKKAGIKLF